MKNAIYFAKSDDWEAIADLNEKAFGQYAARIGPEHWETMRKNTRNVAAVAQRAQFLVIREGERIVASVGYCPAGKSDPLLFPADCASVLLLAVDPEYRGQGLGETLTRACLERAHSDGARFIGLITSEAMTAAQSIYQRLGFAIVREHPLKFGLRYVQYQKIVANNK